MDSTRHCSPFLLLHPSFPASASAQVHGTRCGECIGLLEGGMLLRKSSCMGGWSWSSGCWQGWHTQQVWASYITEGHPRVSCCHSPCCPIDVGVIGVLKCMIGGCMTWRGGHNIITIHHRVMSIYPTTSTTNTSSPSSILVDECQCNPTIGHFSISQVRASVRVNLNISLDLSLCPPLVLLSPSSSPPFPHPLTLL
jgi:hypothetical protein